jgi:hypothetical protein
MNYGYMDVSKRVTKAGISHAVTERLVKSILKRDTEGLTNTIAKEGGGSYYLSGTTGWIVGPKGAETLPEITYNGIEVRENPEA